ncbi:MAG: universal stress protein [bacterium]|nr:MAG: universal stress protein [bacterium]
MYRNILLPTDGVKFCEHAIESGIDLAKALKAKVTGVYITPKLTPFEILEVYHPEILWGPGDAEKAQQAMSHVEDLHRNLADKALAVIEKKATEAGVECEIVYLEGESPAEGILKVAEDKGSDLIFIASHSKVGVAGALFGTVTTKVLAHSKIPVLVKRCE